MQFISRHCDRNIAWGDFLYLEKYKEETKILDMLDLAVGALTPLGQRQCFILGEYMRDRYLNKSTQETFIKDINIQYNMNDYYFIASPIQRTVLSGYFITLGLFPNFGGKKIDVGEFKGEYPVKTGEQGIPYHSTLYFDESLFLRHMTCEKNKKRLNPNNKDFKEYFQNNIKFFEKMKKKTENQFENIEEFYHLSDLIFVLKFHEKLPTDFTEEDFLEIYEESMNIYSFMYSKQHIENLGGGPFLKNVLNEMDIRLKSDNEIVNSEPFYEGNRKKKFIHYSAHDQTLTSIFLALDIIDVEGYEILKYLPHYGAAIIFELHKEDDKNFVKFYFKNGFDQEMMPLKLKQCEYECEYNKFKKILYEISIPKNYCRECGGNQHDVECLIEKVKILEKNKQMNSVLTIMMICAVFILILSMLLALIYLFLTKKSNGYKKIGEN